jgi:hypothetical protein
MYRGRQHSSEIQEQVLLVSLQSAWSRKNLTHDIAPLVRAVQSLLNDGGCFNLLCCNFLVENSLENGAENPADRAAQVIPKSRPVKIGRYMGHEVYVVFTL